MMHDALSTYSIVGFQKEIKDHIRTAAKIIIRSVILMLGFLITFSFP
jgi:hypothetical protein